MNEYYIRSVQIHHAIMASCFPFGSLNVGSGTVELWRDSAVKIRKINGKLIPWGSDSCALIILIRIASLNLLKCASKCAHLTIISRLRDLKLECEQLGCIVTVGKVSFQYRCDD